MAQFYTDFTGYTLAQEPGDWTKRFGTDQTVDVQETDGERNLRVQHTPAAHRMASWDELGSPTDVEVFAVMRQTDNPFGFARVLGLYLRATGADSGSATGYMPHLFAASGGADPDFRISLLVNGSFQSQPSDSTHPFAWAGNVTYACRVRINGSSVRARIWQPANPFTDPTADEPETWHIDFTNTAITGGGWVGFGRQNSSANQRLFALGVGTDGDPAPHEAVGAQADTLRPVAVAQAGSWTVDPDDGTTLDEALAEPDDTHVALLDLEDAPSTMVLELTELGDVNLSEPWTLRLSGGKFGGTAVKRVEVRDSATPEGGTLLGFVDETLTEDGLNVHTAQINPPGSAEDTLYVHVIGSEPT